MTKWLAAMIACVGIGLVSGCGGDDADGGGASTGGSATTAQKAEGAGQKVDVRVKNVKFLPGQVKLKQGGTVRWTNEDSFEHTVTYEAGPGERFNSGELRSADTFSNSFESKGTVAYVCKIHPFQKGEVVVE